MKFFLIISTFVLSSLFLFNNHSNADNENNYSTWIAVVEHEEKKLFYSSDNKKEVNTSEKAINNAISKCWFDPNHKEGDWPSENCKVVSVKKNNNSNNENNTVFWQAESKHPKNNQTFIVTNISTRKEAVNLVMKKCYKFVTNVLKKIGYNDCFLSRSFSVNESYQNITTKPEEIHERNQQWISANKQTYIDLFNKKLNEYEAVITELNIKRDKLKIKVLEFEEMISDINNDINNTIEGLTNKTNEKTETLINEISENQKKYLSSTNINEFKSRLNYINTWNIDEYYNYIALKDLLERAEKSKKMENFVGSKPMKVLDITFKQSKIGLIQEFDDIKNKDFDYQLVRDQKFLNELYLDIDKSILNINDFILKPTEKLIAVNVELNNKVDYFKLIKLNPYYKALNLTFNSLR